MLGTADCNITLDLKATSKKIFDVKLPQNPVNISGLSKMHHPSCSFTKVARVIKLTISII